MRNKFLLLLILVFFGVNTMAQKDPNVYPFSYGVDGSTTNKIQIPNSGSKYLSGNLIFYISPTTFGNFLQVNTNFALVDNSTILFTKDGPSFHKASDFQNGSETSILKNFQFSIPETVLTNIKINHPNAKFVLRYKYMILGGATFPSVSSGLQYYIDDYKYGLEFTGPTLPKPEISGPSTICSDATYIITNSTNVTLETNPSIATLTSLGNNQWKITRNGSTNGVISLKATNSANQTVTKKLVIGVAQLPEIEGPSESVYGSNILLYLPPTVNNGVVNWTYSGLPTGSVVSDLGNGTVNITLPRKNANHPNSGYFSVQCTINSECGNAMVTKHINYSNASIDPDGGDVGPVN